MDEHQEELVTEEGTKYQLRRLMFSGEIHRRTRGNREGAHIADFSASAWKWRRVFTVSFQGEPVPYRQRLKGFTQCESTVRCGDAVVLRTNFPIFSRRQYITNNDDVSLYSVRKLFAWYSSRKIYRDTRSQFGPRRPLASIRAVQPLHHQLKVLDSSITRNELTALLFFLILVNELDSHR